VDVCVIGAGIAGLATADLLTRYGKRVALLDNGAIAGGSTRCSTAHLTAVLDTRDHELERLHGTEGMQAAARSHIEAIDRISSIVRHENIHCDFQQVDGYLFGTPGSIRSSTPPVSRAPSSGTAVTGLPKRTLPASKAAYLSYVIGALVPRGSVPRGLDWDTA
jgi:glycine/D-amino acid oxidase-like deaminating enzyme